jgi:hypothetical protein
MSRETDRLKRPGATGYFLFSLDTELAWGYYDRFKPADFSPDGRRERQSLRLLLDIFREYRIRATMGVVGHLFYEKCEKCAVCPVKRWDQKYASFNQIYESDSRLWYGPDVIRMIRDEGDRHEIAFHGYTHRPFDETMMNRDEARIEIEEWLRLADRERIKPLSVIFPRNRVGHLDLFTEHGFRCYRSPELTPKSHGLPLIGKVMRRNHRRLSSFIPASGFDLRRPQTGELVKLPSTQHLFGYHPATGRRANALDLHKVIIRSMRKGIHRAAEEKKVFHLYAHPNDFRSEKDLEIARGIGEAVSEEVKKGRLVSITMAELAEIALRRSAGDAAKAGGGGVRGSGA